MWTSYTEAPSRRSFAPERGRVVTTDGRTTEGGASGYDAATSSAKVAVASRRIGNIGNNLVARENAPLPHAPPL